MLRKRADLPAVEVVKGLHQVLCARPQRLSSVTRIASIS
jgi:hypothetical protein